MSEVTEEPEPWEYVEDGRIITPMIWWDGEHWRLGDEIIDDD